MEVLAAQDQLFLLSVADWPKMKKSSRDKMHRSIHRIAFPRTHSEPIGPQELAKILGAGRITPRAPNG